MNRFRLQLQGATQFEKLDNIVSFVGEDASGSFGLMSGHSRFVTTLVFGLARMRFDDDRWEYLALPGAVVDFEGNRLILSTRRYLRGDDYTQISQALRQDLVIEEQKLSAIKQNLEQIERAMLQRLWRAGRSSDVNI